AQLSHRGTTGMTDPRREQQLGSLVPGRTGEPASATSGGDRVRRVEVDLAEPFGAGGPGAVRRWRRDVEQPVAELQQRALVAGGGIGQVHDRGTEQLRQRPCPDRLSVQGVGRVVGCGPDPALAVDVPDGSQVAGCETMASGEPPETTAEGVTGDPDAG